MNFSQIGKFTDLIDKVIKVGNQKNQKFDWNKPECLWPL